MRVKYPPAGFQIGLWGILVLFGTAPVHAQHVLLSTPIVQVASGQSFELTVRCDQIPQSLAAALVLRASRPAISRVFSSTDTLSGIAPSFDTISATDYFQMRFSLAQGAGLTSLRSKIRLTIGDDTVPAGITAVELLYVPVPGPVVKTVPIKGIQVLLNEKDEEEQGPEPPKK